MFLMAYMKVLLSLQTWVKDEQTLLQMEILETGVKMCK